MSSQDNSTDLTSVNNMKEVETTKTNNAPNLQNDINGCPATKSPQTEI